MTISVCGNKLITILPCFLLIWSCFAFIICYVIAVKRDDVARVFPYISDIAFYKPESQIFSQMMNISVMAAFVCIYIRYKQIQNLLCDACAISINRLSCAFGIISSLGISMVANFQEKTTLKLIHEIGAGLLMISGILYQMTQSYLTYKTSKDKICFCCRLLILVISLTASIATQVTKFIVESDMLCNNHWFHWTPGESNYKMHIVSAATEWIVAFAFLIFFATFTLDFSQCSLHVQAIVHPQTDKRTLRTLTVEQENPDIIPLLPLN